MIRRRPILLDDLGLRKAAEGAFIKLLAALPALSRRDAVDIHQRIHIDAAGWIRLTFAFETEEVAWSHVLSFGSLLEVLEPQELRKKTAQIAATLLTLYQEERVE